MPAIHTLDLHYLGIPHSIAAYVIVGPGGPLLIETGPASTLEHLEAGLARLGLKLAAIRHALVTHIHLDHAGAAGHLARNGTRIYVHELGAKHLIDPSKLIESATRIYGTQMDRLWGRLLPVPHDQVTPLRDGQTIDACGLRFAAIQTPGHAKHHHAFALGKVCFSGDIAGITVPASVAPRAEAPGFTTVPTPPPEFDLEAWLASIDRLQSMNFDAIYPTHFGEVRNVTAHFDRLRVLVQEHAHLVRRDLDAGRPRTEILQHYLSWNRDAARRAGMSDADFARYVSTNLLTMNVDGMIRYWTKRAEAVAESLPSVK